MEGLGEGGMNEVRTGDRTMEFHIARKARDELGLDSSLFRSTGNVIIPDFATARALARRINERMDAALLPERAVRAGQLNAMALIDEILHDVARLFREGPAPKAFEGVLAAMETQLGRDALDGLLLAFVKDFPPLAVYRGELGAKDWLEAAPGGLPNRLLAVEEFLLLKLANENPAFGPCRFLFDDGSREDGPVIAGNLADLPAYEAAIAAMEGAFAALPHFGPDDQDLVTMLRAPAKASPYSLPGQLDYIRKRWGLLLGERLLRLLGALDLIREEEKPYFPGPGPTRAYAYRGMETEIERFSPDKDWMPNVVMMAKSTLVWLHQLSVAYGRDIRTLDAIPDEELDTLAMRGFNGLWLIGLWERSQASAEIKRRCGNPEAAASAYSLFDYEIAGELGGWPALERLREKCSWRGIRLAADMVPNHTGIDSAWVRERPELFMRRADCPYPGYTFNGPDLSGDGRTGIWLEDHYWDRTDAAVVFKRLDRGSGAVDYIYHGNDGTGLPWSDTAQIDFLNPAAREAVKERILHVARNFPIIRFDAAMVLAKKHFRRLWYPEPGSGGDVPSRAERALPQEDFDRAMPQEFWREVVDLCAKEAPDTLLLAEAFWMMEGYFVRSLGMHRVYNSAFMNMLKNEENAKYRETIRNTQEFDKDILKRFVNFMNNPDEDTAVAQFGKGDKYFGVCTMMATMPGLPMFGHGQVEGFTEKYGMEYRRAYRDESPDPDLVERHEREIFPLLKRRRLFSGVEQFLLYDVVQDDSSVNGNVFAWSNGSGADHALVVYNNAYARAFGHIRVSCPYAEKTGGGKRTVTKSLAEALGLHAEEGCFLVMREERSGLWFLRRSRDIAERGLALALDGYQSQVFLDLFEARDDGRGLYDELCDSLGGRGVPDLSEALEDLALKELYAILGRLAGRSLFTGLRSLVEPGLPAAKRRKEALALAGRLAPAAEEFYAAVGDLLDAERPDGEPEVEAEAGTEDAGTADAGVPLPERAIAATLRFSRGILAAAELAILADEAAAPYAGKARPKAVEPGTAEPAPPAPPATVLAGRGVAGLLRKPWGAEKAAACLVLEGLVALAGRTSPGEAARRIIERAFLERKLREAMRAAGVPGDETYRSVALTVTFLARSGELALALDGSRTQGPAARACEIEALLEGDEDFRHKLGVNLFDGVEWFNKEAFEEALDMGTLVSFFTAGLEPGGGPGAKARAGEGFTAAERAALVLRVERADAIADIFRLAEIASGFRLGELGRLMREEAARRGDRPDTANADKKER
jgi:glycosidase